MLLFLPIGTPHSSKWKIIKCTKTLKLRLLKCVTCVTIPFVIEALGLINKGVEKNTSLIPGDIKIHQMQKFVLVETAHIVRKALSIT